MPITWERTGASSYGEAPATHVAMRTQPDRKLTWSTGHGSLQVDAFLLADSGQGVPALESVALRLGLDLSDALDLVGIAGIVVSPSAMSRTYGAASAVPSDSSTMEWARTNERRVYLINKGISVGLSEPENSELGRLQEMMGRQLDARTPIPTGRLEELERVVAGLK